MKAHSRRGFAATNRHNHNGMLKYGQEEEVTIVAFKQDRQPIIIIGMTRSGTTFVSHLLRSMPGVHLEMEPHVLWKAGNFHHLADNLFDLKPDALLWIRNKLLKKAAGKVLVEKSPPNCVRPKLVHAVFPDAKIIYVERDPIRCINSNFKKTLLQESFSPSIVFNKYLLPKILSDVQSNGTNAFNKPLMAHGGSNLYQQLRYQDLFQFTRYVLKMLFIRNAHRAVPFGPKIEGFKEIIRKYGALTYHVRVYRAAESCKQAFEELYGTNFALFRLEEIHSKVEEVQRLYHVCGFDVADDWVCKVFKGFNPEIIKSATAPGPHDKDIEKLLSSDAGP